MKYDIAIIGSGPGGLACAKKARAFGLTTALVEQDQNHLGGVCLNTGCIPTKFFLHRAGSSAQWENIFREKNSAIDQMKRPLPDFFRKSGIDLIWGKASFRDPHTLEVGSRKITARVYVIAVGSRPQIFLQGKGVMPAEQIFSCPRIGRRSLIVGAGYIGIEIAGLLRQFGQEVTVVEKEPRILSGFDRQITARLKTALKKRGIEIHTGKDIHEYPLNEYDHILVAAGRTAHTDGLGLEHTPIARDSRGWILTDEYLRTKEPHIYACGDVNGKYLLAYTAAYQGELIAANAAGKSKKENYPVIPSCVFSSPQLARVGIGRQEAERRKITHSVLGTHFAQYSSARVYDDTEGYLELIVGEDHRILGASVLSERAAELIHIITVCVQRRLTTDNLAEMMFVHPTLSEIIPFLAQEA
ncbi:MAG: FAD-binding protein [Candidatus Omnitrophica bacterium]|nr:FAD-binding protein [Candidatus Omnitrophota bacterium]